MYGCSFTPKKLANEDITKRNDSSLYKVKTDKKDNEYFEKLNKSNGIIYLTISKENRFYKIEKESKKFNDLESCQKEFNSDLNVINDALDSNKKSLKIEDVTIIKAHAANNILIKKECSINNEGKFDYHIDLTQQNFDNLKPLKIILEGIGNGLLVVFFGAFYLVAAVILTPLIILSLLAYAYEEITT